MSSDSKRLLVTPTLPMDEVLACIARLKAYDFHDTSVEEIKEELKILLAGFVITTPVVEPGVVLYRARKIALLDPPATISEIGAPSPALVKKHGRCNRRGESVFYCSAARNAPFFEVDAHVGDRLVLASWATTARAVVNNVGYTASTFERLQSSRKCPDWSNGETRRFVEREEHRAVVNEFLAQLFSAKFSEEEDEYQYKATIAVTEKLVPTDVPEGAARFDGLMYPTIPMAGNCENFALRPEFVSRGLAFVKAEYLLIREVTGMSITFDILDFAVSANEGRLEWKGRKPEWVITTGAALTFVADRGQWIARDPDGRVVNPQ